MRSYFGWWDKSVICCLKWCGILYFVLVYRQSAERNQLESSRVRYSFCCYCCSFFFVSFICAYIFFFEKNVGHFFSSILFWCGELTLHKLWKIQILISLFSLCMKFHCACDFFPLIISEAASEFLYSHTTSEHAVSSSKKVFNTEVLYMYAIHRTTWNFPYCISTVLH